jgi:hypothetical protein
MADANDQEQPTSTPEQSVDTQPTDDTKELSLTEQLSAAREEDPETIVEDEPAKTDVPAADDEDQPKDDPAPTDADKDTPTDETPKTEETEAERNARFYALRQQEKAQTQTEVEKNIDDNYAPQSTDELKQKHLDAGRSEFEAEVLAREERRDQEAQLSQARAQLVELNANLNIDALRVIHEFPEFDEKSKEFDKDFTERARAMYQRVSGTQYDEKSGVVVHTNIKPYEFFKELHDLRTEGMSHAQAAAQRAAEQQMASVASPTSSPTPQAEPSAEDAQATRLENAFKNVS